MTDLEFKTQINRARTLAQLESHEKQYFYLGFQRGLRRQYHGDTFGTPEEHETWMSLSSSDDPARTWRGVGYRAGLYWGILSADRPQELRQYLDLSDEQMALQVLRYLSNEL